MFRFLAPVAMIICCDVMSYMFGFFFGKTPLIKLSPKKTWEGFIGGAFSTVLFGIAVYFFLYTVITFLSFPTSFTPVSSLSAPLKTTILIIQTAPYLHLSLLVKSDYPHRLVG